MRLKLNSEFKCSQGGLRKRRSVSVRLAPQIYAAIGFLLISWERPLMLLGQQTYLEEQNNSEIVFKIMGTHACFFPSTLICFEMTKWSDSSSQGGGEKQTQHIYIFFGPSPNRVLTSESVWKWVIILEIRLVFSSHVFLGKTVMWYKNVDAECIHYSKYCKCSVEDHSKPKINWFSPKGGK